MPDDAPTLHLIGHAHIDPVWLWQWPEGFQEIKATFRSALDRMEEDDEFAFTASSVAFYEWIHRNDPAMFEEIANRVAEGRWYVVGGWWVEADCNLASGESYARQALVGQRWLQEHLGVTATVGFNPDSFGHNAMLPQILAKSGLSSYVFMRPVDHERGLPGRTFWWESDDGARVLAFRIAYEYLSWPKEVDEHVRRCAAELKAPHTQMMCFYGVGNHGGGPTRENLESIHRLGDDADLPKLVMSHPGRFFAAVRESSVPLPIVHSELQNHARGCYASHSGIKQWNRRAERLLLDAERLSTIAARVIGHRTVEDLGRAWKNVLFNQFHDILSGTSIEPAYTDARDQLGETAAIAGRAIHDALQSITWNVDIPADSRSIPVVIWNPHSWASSIPVELEVGRFPTDPVVVDDEGRTGPVQQVQSLATVKGGRARLAFLAELPPVGYRLYRVVAGGDALPDVPNVEASDTVLDNGLLRVEVDQHLGVSRIYDHRHDVDVTGDGALCADVIGDPSDTWGHGVVQFGDIVGTFEVERVSRIEHGAVRAAVRIESRFGSSRLIQDLFLHRDLPYLDVRATVDWREQFKVLKLRFPVNVHAPTVTYEIPFGTLQRGTDGDEVPGQRWVDLTGRLRDRGTIYGLSVMTDSKQSFDVRGDRLSLTVLRSPIHAHHDPRVPSDDALYSFQDQGIQRFAYRLGPHAGSWVDGGTVRLAAELDLPPTALIESAHAGALPRSDSFLRIDAPNVVLSALKEAEDGGALIVRCYESAGEATTATIELPRWGRRIEASFGQSEIKTFRVPDDPQIPVTEVNLLEQEDPP
jgi:alpha-mannosidase